MLQLLLIEIHSLSRHWRTTRSQYEDTTSQSMSLNMSVLLHLLGSKYLGTNVLEL